jgi:hypothetical protein
MLSAALSWFDRSRRDRQPDGPLPVPQMDPDWPRCLADPSPQFVPVPVAQPDDEPGMDAPPVEDRRLFDDAGQPIRIPGDEAPANPHPDTGLRFPRTTPSGPSTDTQCAVAEELAAARHADWSTPTPDYSRTGSVLAGIDKAIDDSLAASNQALRVRLRHAEAEWAHERSQRQDTQVRLVAAQARIAELELTVRALGGLVAHAAGHDTSGAEQGTEGGEP